MSWRVARSLDTLLAEVNAAAPNRSKLADGSIGDPAHAARESDHNPNAAGVVRARDITHDPADGCDADELAEHVRRLALAGHPALGPGAYVIWNWRIASATEDSQPWDWEPYSGSNGHTQHVHISVATAAAGYDSTAPWGWNQEDDMADYAEELKAIKADTTAIRADLAAVKRQNAKIREKVTRLIARVKKGDTSILAELEELQAALDEQEA